MAEWQVQKTRDGHNWVPMKPRSDQPELSMDPGEHWFPEHRDALIAAQHLRNALTWSEVRIAERDDSGEIVRIEEVL